MTHKNLSPYCERLYWDCAPDYPIALLDVYCMFVFSPFFSTPLYASDLPVSIYLLFIIVWCFVLRPNSPTGPSLMRGPLAQNTAGQITCQPWESPPVSLPLRVDDPRAHLHSWGQSTDNTTLSQVLDPHKDFGQ